MHSAKIFSFSVDKLLESSEKSLTLLLLSFGMVKVLKFELDPETKSLGFNIAKKYNTTMVNYFTKLK